jgi:imidazolonepropionase-like amidohydrolase
MTSNGAKAILAGALIDGSGRDPVRGAVVVVEEGRVVAAGARAQVAMPRGVEVLDAEGMIVLPGLIDCHVHLGMREQLSVTNTLMIPTSLNYLYCVPNAAATLQAGITTARDAGLTPVGVKLAIERKLFPGPRLQVSVAILSQTGGHADETMPCGAHVPLINGLDLAGGMVVDGVDAVRRGARAVLRAGAGWVKLCTSGGVLSPSDEPTSAQFTVEEIAAAVYEAGEQGKRCLAHAISARGIKNALRAGVASIEHGCYLDEEGVALMKAKGAYLVPTLSAPRAVLERAKRDPGALPEIMVAKARAVAEHHRQSFILAVRSGVKIAMGTDSAVGPHGQNAQELRLMVDEGMAPMDAVRASTAAAAELLGLGDQVGTLEAGKWADLMVVEGDPLGDIGVLADPARVRLVWKAGVAAKDALANRAASPV